MSIYPDPDPNRDPNYDPIHPDLDIDTSRDLSYTNNNYGGDLQQTTTLTLTNDPALTPISLEIPIANHVDTHDFQQFSHHVTPSRRSSPNPSKGSSPKMADTVARRSSQQGSKVKQRTSSSNTLEVPIEVLGFPDRLRVLSSSDDDDDDNNADGGGEDKHNYYNNNHNFDIDDSFSDCLSLGSLPDFGDTESSPNRTVQKLPKIRIS